MRRRSAAQALRRVERRLDDPGIAGAAAQIAGERLAHVLLARFRLFPQQLGQRDQHARRAEAALQAVIVDKGLLQNRQLAVGRKALDRRHLAVVRLHRKHQARARRVAVDQHRAGAAHAVLAAEMRAGEVEFVAQEIGERQPRIDHACVGLAVDRDPRRLLAHGRALRLHAGAARGVVERAQAQDLREMTAVLAAGVDI